MNEFFREDLNDLSLKEAKECALMTSAPPGNFPVFELTNKFAKCYNVKCTRFNRTTKCLFTCLFIFWFSDKPEVKIVVEFPEGLTREGENLELTCMAKGKPQ